MRNLTVNLQRLHDKDLWSVQWCLVQVCVGEIVVHTLSDARPGVGAFAVVVAMVLQLWVMSRSTYICSPATDMLASIPDEERHHPVAQSITMDDEDGKSTGLKGNPGSLRAIG